jgi:hypothetical protein
MTTILHITETESAALRRKLVPLLQAGAFDDDPEAKAEVEALVKAITPWWEEMGFDHPPTDEELEAAKRQKENGHG